MKERNVYLLNLDNGNKYKIVKMWNVSKVSSSSVFAIKIKWRNEEPILIIIFIYLFDLNEKNLTHNNIKSVVWSSPHWLYV